MDFRVVLLIIAITGFMVLLGFGVSMNLFSDLRSVQVDDEQCLDNVERLIEEAGGYELSENKDKYQLWLNSCNVLDGTGRRRAEAIGYRIKYATENWQTARDEIRAEVL